MNLTTPAALWKKVSVDFAEIRNNKYLLLTTDDTQWSK